MARVKRPMNAFMVWSRVQRKILGILFPSYIKKFRRDRTAKKQYRKFETNIPRKGIAQISTFMCLWAICIFPRLICLFCCRKICGPILGI
jgi:hypothetical protein